MSKHDNLTYTCTYSYASGINSCSCILSWNFDGLGFHILTKTLPQNENPISLVSTPWKYSPIRQSSSSLSLHQLPGGFHLHPLWSLPSTLSPLLPQSPAKNDPQWRFCESICPFKLFVPCLRREAFSDSSCGQFNHWQNTNVSPFILDTPPRHTYWGTHESLMSNWCHQTKTNTAIQSLIQLLT